MEITKIDIDAIAQILIYMTILAFMIGLFLASVSSHIYRIMIRKFNRPSSVKTSDGRLYRADNGVYVEKYLLEKINNQCLLINKKRHISMLKKRIKYLESDIIVDQNGAN